MLHDLRLHRVGYEIDIAQPGDRITIEKNLTESGRIA
jgi:hypothetical protein